MRLRTLFLVVAGFAIVFAYPGYKLQAARDEQRVAEWIRAMGGSVNHERSHRTVMWDGYEPTWTRQILNRWIGDEVRHVDLSNTRVTDLSHLIALRNVISLRLNDTNAKDLSPLSQMKNLKSLNITNTRVEDLSPLTPLDQLNFIAISGPSATDLSPLAARKRLTVILDDSQMSNNAEQGVTMCDWSFIYPSFLDDMQTFEP